MIETIIESGFAKVEAGTWLAGRAQPAACLGTAAISGLKGFVVPDRGWVRKVEVAAAKGLAALPAHDGRAGSMSPPPDDAPDGRAGSPCPPPDDADGRARAPRPPLAWFAAADAPFLTRLDALPDDPLHLVSSKLLVAPFSSRVGAMALKLIPLSFQRATPVTDFRTGWAVAATRSRVARVALEDGETLTVRPESLVAWTGPKPTGFCPKLSVWDMILPRAPKNLAFTFHGAAVVWFEGSGVPAGRARTPAAPRAQGRFA